MKVNNSTKYYKYPYQTPGWSSIHSNQQEQYTQSLPKHNYHHHNIENKQKAKQNSMSILEKLQAAKFKNIEDIDISSKINKRKMSNFAIGNGNNEGESKYYNLSDMGKESKGVNSGKKGIIYDRNKENNLLTFSPVDLKNLKNNKFFGNKYQKNQKKQTQNLRNVTPNRNKYAAPTQAWINRITPQKLKNDKHQQSTSNIKNINNSSHTNRTKQKDSSPLSKSRRQPLAQVSIHQQLYLQSKKKDIKRSAQQIIQNQYFKKKHPFAPQIGQVSQFLANQRISRLKQRQKFEMQFQQFDQDDETQVSQTKKSTKLQTKSKKDYFDYKQKRQLQQKQAQIKNYSILKNFYYFLTNSQQLLIYSHLQFKKLVNLPQKCIKLLEPILETFYMNKKKKSLSWLEFLSEFNLKIKNKKSFYMLIEKWFLMTYDVKFQAKENKNDLHEYYGQKQTETNQQNNNKTLYKEQSTYGGQSRVDYDKQSSKNLKKRSISNSYTK